MKNKNPYAPDLPKEQINKIAWEFSEEPSVISSDSVRQLKELSTGK